jgi:hypothetical protein
MNMNSLGVEKHHENSSTTKGKSYKIYGKEGEVSYFGDFPMLSLWF